MSLPLLDNIGAADTTISVGSAITDSPDGGVLTIESEIINYQSADSSRFYGCVRGAQGTTAATHAKDKGVTYTPKSSVTNPIIGKGQLSFQNISADLGTTSPTPETTIFTPEKSGMYLVSFYGLVTADIGGSDSVPNIYVSWTDERGGQTIFTPPFGGTFDPTYTDGPNSATFPIYAVAGTPIWFRATGGVYATSLRLSFYFTVTKL